MTEIAAASGVSPASVSLWETNQRTPGTRNALAYRRSLATAEGKAA